MANTAAILDVVLRAQTSRATVELKKFSKELDKTSRQAKATDKSVTDTDKSFSKLGGSGGSVDRANRNMMLLKNTVSLIKFPALITGAGVAAQAVSALGAGAAGLVSALAPLSGLLAAYPALFGAFAQASGVMAVAGVDDLTTVVGGLNDKLDETSDDFKKLSPQAQDFARTLQTAKKPLLDIQKTVQKPLFEGLNDGLDAAMENMPALESVAKDTASVMGDLAREAGKFAGREGFGRDFAKVGASNAQLLGRLGEAGLHFGDALRHVMVAARPLIDFLGKGAVIFSEWIEAQAKAGRESGAMADFFDRTRKVVSQLVQIGGTLGGVFLDIGKAARPLGEDILAELVHQAELLADWTSSNQGKLRAYFDDAAGPLAEAGKLLKDLVGGFFELANTPGLSNLIKQFRKELLPALLEMTETTTKQFGPVLIDTLTSISKLLTNFLGSSGVLTGFVKLIGTAADTLNSLFESIPGLASAASSALAGFSIFKLLGLGGLSGAGQAGGLMSTIGAKIGTQFGTGVANAAGPVIAGGIASFIAGIPVGHLLADSMQQDAVEDPDLLLRAMGMEDPNALINIMRQVTDKSGELLTKNVIRKWVQSGDISVAQGARMIRALKDVNQQVAHLSAQQGQRKGFGFAQGLVDEGKVMQPAINNILDKLDALPKNAREIASRTMLDWAKVLESKGKLPVGTVDKLSRAIEKRWGQLPKSADKSGKDTFQNWDKWMKQTAKSGDRNSSDLRDDVVRNMNDLKDSGINSAKQLNRGVTGSVNSMAKAVSNGFKRIEDATNKALAAFGVDAVAFAIGEGASSNGGGGNGHQTGGVIVPGQGSGDKVPAMLEPGEVVLNRNAVAALGGAQRANSVNRKIPRFADGGVVGLQSGGWLGTVGGVQLDKRIIPDAQKLLDQYKLAFNAGYAPTGHAADGEHPLGLALDIGPSAAGSWNLVDELAHFAEPSQNNPIHPWRWVGYDGDVNHGRGNHLHLSWDHTGGLPPPVPSVETMGGMILGAAEKIKKVLLEGPAGPLKDIGQGALDKVRSAANKFIAKQSPAVTPETGGVSGLPTSGGALSKNQIRQLLQAHGMPDIMGYVAYAESGFDPNAGNGSYEGLWALGQPFWQQFGGQGDWMTNVHDPNQNAAVAAKGHDALGMQPWEASRNAGAGGGWGQHLGETFKQGGIVQMLAEGGIAERIRDVQDKIERVKDRLAGDKLTSKERARIGELKDLLKKKGLSKEKRKRYQGELTDLQAQAGQLDPGDRRKLEKLQADLEKKLERLREKLRKRREERAHQIAKKGLHPELREKLQKTHDKIAEFEENINIYSTLFGLDTSEAGSEYSPPELAALQKLYGGESGKRGVIQWHMRRRDIAQQQVDAATERLDAIEDLLGDKKTPHWQRLALQTNRGSIKAMRRDAHGVVIEEQGVTGKGGFIFDAQMELAGLGGNVATTEPLFDALTVERLREFAQAVRYGAFNRDPFGTMPVMHSGGVVPGPPGANVPIMAQAGEGITSVSDMNGGTWQLTITNWETGQGMIRRVAAGEVNESNRRAKAAYAGGNA